MAEATPPENQQQTQQNTWLYVAIAIVGGCGCLIVMVFLLGLGSALYAILGVTKEQGDQSPPPTEVPSEPPAPDQAPDYDPAQEVSRPSVELPEEQQPTGEPGQHAALVFALAHFDKFSNGTIVEHHDGWREVAVIMGPAEGQWEYGVWLQWDDQSNQYTVTGEGAYDPETGSILDAVPDDSSEVPDIYQPGPGVAKEAALVDFPNWVAKVVSHSSDYRKVVVWIGPPQSEWVSEITLQWSTMSESYRVVEEGEVPVDYGG